MNQLAGTRFLSSDSCFALLQEGGGKTVKRTNWRPFVNLETTVNRRKHLKTLGCSGAWALMEEG